MKHRTSLIIFTAALFCGIAQAKSPNIDQLALDGVKFTNPKAAYHVCSPTRASILTGKYPARLNLTDWLPGRRDFPFQRLKNVEINQHLPYEKVTIAEKLKDSENKVRSCR